MAELGTSTSNGYLILHAGHDSIIKTVPVLTLGGAAGIASGDYVEIPHIGVSGVITGWYIKADASGSVTLGLDYASSFGGAYSQIENIDLSSSQTNSQTGLAHSIVEDGMLRLQADSDGTTLTQAAVALVIEKEVN